MSEQRSDNYFTCCGRNLSDTEMFLLIVIVVGAMLTVVACDVDFVLHLIKH